MTGEAWFKPAYQPREGVVVEFLLRPLDLQTSYEAQTTLLPSGAVAWASLAKIFAQFVVDWRGLGDVRCDQAARLEVILCRKDAHGVPLRDWLVWLAAIAQRAYNDTMLTEEERKN